MTLLPELGYGDGHGWSARRDLIATAYGRSSDEWRQGATCRDTGRRHGRVDEGCRAREDLWTAALGHFTGIGGGVKRNALMIWKLNIRASLARSGHAIRAVSAPDLLGLVLGLPPDGHANGAEPRLIRAQCSCFDSTPRAFTASSHLTLAAVQHG